VALAGIVLLAAGITLRWPGTVPWAVLAVGAGYVLGRAGAHVVEGWAAVVGVLLLLGAELATASIEHDARIPAEWSLLRHRAATLVALLLGALFVNFLLLASAAVSAPAGVLLAAVGVAAAVTAVAVVLRLVRA
jgi:hypothetical protein